MKQTLALYWNEVRLNKKLLIPTLLFIPLAIFLNTYATGWIIAHVINELTTNTYSPDTLFQTFSPWIIAYIISIALGELVLWRAVLFLGWTLETKVIYGLNRKSFDTLATQSLDFHNARFGGSLVSQVNKFASSFVILSNMVMFNLLPLMFSFLFTFIILGPQLPLFTAFIAVFAAVFMIIATISFKNVQKLTIAEAETKTKLSGQLADSITNIMAVKGGAHEDVERSRYDVLNVQASKATNNLMVASTKRDIGFGVVIVALSGLAFIVLIGGQQWFGVQIGTLVLAITYSTQILGQLWGFNNILRATSRAFGDAYEMTNILQEAHSVVDIPNAKKLKIKKGKIEFRNVAFRHADALPDDMLFKNLSFDIKAGEQVGFVGPSGSGKTTLTRLLLRFTDLQSGAILFDNQDISKVTQQSLRHSVAYVPQEPLLFHRSIRENIAYGKPNATDREVIKAAKQAHAWEFIKKMPAGLDTVVGERGVKLSGGQRQRIAISRAIIKDAPILVLDEATSALDSESEALIQDALAKLMKSRTSIVIAHRLSTISKLDRIVVLKDGEIAEQGSHEELVKAKGSYAKLWKHQSGGFIEE
ncbi:MAG: MdlB [Candidatus Saccharibacteria bacterium]|nr:MdlB [Candidatus Saccharibacteria bacterium]